MSLTPSPQTPEPWRQLTALSGLVLVVAALLTWIIYQGRPVPLPAIADLANGRIPCMSYAPFRFVGHSPADPGLIIAPAQIEADLRRLRELTGCVRTYGVDHGLDAVPEIARKLDLRVVLGAWIDSDATRSTAQLERVLALGRDYADVVNLLVIGNEVLLRGEQTPEALAALLARAKRDSAVPIAYADVWAFWLRHAEVLRAHVDVVAAHVLPYWEDNPVAVDQAIDHILAINTQLKAVFAPLPVFIGETGWPAAGRQRGPAVPGRLEQTRFVRELLAVQASTPLGSRADVGPGINLIEGFDQPWKRSQEGTMGGYWGVFDANGRQRVTLRGAVVPDPQWWHLLLAMFAGGGAGLLWPLRHSLRPIGTGAEAQRQRIVAAAATSLAGCVVFPLALLQWRILVEASYRPLDWVLGGGVAVAAGLCALAAADRIARILVGRSSAGTRPSMFAARHPAFIPGTQMLVFTHAALLGCVTLIALGLVFDARYRPLVWPILGAPTVLLLTLTVLGERISCGAWLERGLASVGAIAAVVMFGQEGFANTQALGFALICLGLATAVGWPQSLTSPSGSAGSGG